MTARPTKWIKLFREFTRDLRITSKEATTTDSLAPGVKLVLWDSQNIFLENLAEGLEDQVREFWCDKSRQVGCTTVSLGIDAFFMAMYPGTIGALVSDTEVNRDANRVTLEGYIASLPDGYFGETFEIVRSNSKFILFSNGSRLDLLVAGTRKKATWGEGRGYAYCHCTEVANYGDAEGLRSFIESLAQKNPNRLFIFESTAKGFNHWFAMYDSAKKDPLTKRAFFIGWWASPMNRIERKDPRFEQYDYMITGEEKEKIDAVEKLYGHRVTIEQLAWYRWKASQSASDELSLHQNQPWTEDESFVLTGFSFFPLRTVSREVARIREGREQYYFRAYRYVMGNDFWGCVLEEIRDPAKKKLVQLRVWEEPQPNGKYAIGMDPAWGRTEHKDRHAIEVYRCFADRLVQVAEFATADMEIKHAAWVCAHLAGVYRDCWVNIELGGPGRIIMEEWDSLKYQLRSELYQKQAEERGWEDFLFFARWYLYHRPDSFGAGYAANFETTNRTKWEIMHQLKGTFITGDLDISSLPLLQEMQIVVQNGNEIGAPESKGEDQKDDRVFATALANRIWLNWRRAECIANMETYEAVMAEELGETTPTTRNINSMVRRFFEKKVAEAEAGPAPDWRDRHGLR